MNTPGNRKLSEAEFGAIKNVKGNIKLLRDTAEESLPSSRELALALTKLDEAEMWMTRAITTHGLDD